MSFTGINFLMFGIMEIYWLIAFEDKVVDYTPREAMKQPLIVLSYYHLYYQFNIYIGIFFFFSIVMYVIYYINERSHHERVDEIIENLERNIIKAEGKEEPCPICLSIFIKNEKIYQLNCTHIFH